MKNLDDIYTEMKTGINMPCSFNFRRKNFNLLALSRSPNLNPFITLQFRFLRFCLTTDIELSCLAPCSCICKFVSLI